jgi:glycosyltransferase involved in cell wall biosynthesis
MQGTLHLIAPSAPPKICGVGDHSFFLGQALSSRTRLKVHCGQKSPAPDLGALDATTDFDHRFPWTLLGLSRLDEFRPGDTVLVQYTNFAYGRWGFNPWIAPALSRLRRKGLRVTTMFHETYMPATGVKVRTMGAWQRVFFRQVGLASQLCLFSVEPWTLQYRSWFPRSVVETLPVGSNIPLSSDRREAERRKLGIPAEVPVLVVFGGTHPSRLFDWIVSASMALTESGVDHRILRIGPDGDEVARRLSGLPLVDRGILPPEIVSATLRCGDVFLSPISDGASSRRGSLLAGLQHGLACLTTQGPSTDDLFRESGDVAMEFAADSADFSRRTVELVRDPGRRADLGRNGSTFYAANFSWESIADHYLELAGRIP